MLELKEGEKACCEMDLDNVYVQRVRHYDVVCRTIIM